MVDLRICDEYCGFCEIKESDISFQLPSGKIIFVQSALVWIADRIWTKAGKTERRFDGNIDLGLWII